MSDLKQVEQWLQAALPSDLTDLKQLPNGYEEFWKSLVVEELEETVQALKESNQEEVLDGCVDMIWMVLNIVQKLNLWKQFYSKYSQVSLSNESKFIDSEEEAKQTVEAYKNGTHFSNKSFKEVFYKEILYYGFIKYVVYTLIDGNERILKPIKSYWEPNNC